MWKNFSEKQIKNLPNLVSYINELVKVNFVNMPHPQAFSILKSTTKYQTFLAKNTKILLYMRRVTFYIFL